jgi:Adenylate cyclase, family 3 (some proteins contain HAMP domain)
MERSSGATFAVTETHLVLALASVDGATAACAEHGDRPTLAVLSEYYAVIAASARSCGGRVVKVMGDGVVLAFPPERAQDAVAALRSAQQETTRLWQAFDARCHVGVRVSAGSVLAGSFGPPGEERPDIFGDALNRLFRTPPGAFVLTAQVEALLR